MEKELVIDNIKAALIKDNFICLIADTTDGNEIEVKIPLVKKGE